jgi:general secretion pathway protein F
MPLFEYQGLSQSGKNVRGTLDAENQRTARVRLKKDGIYVVDLKDKSKAAKRAKGKKPASSRRVGVADLALMTRQLASLLKANIPLVEALAAVADQVENATLSEAVSDIKNMVNEGSTLFKALGKYPKIFNRTYISMCEAGETSGTLDVILLRLAEFTEAQNNLANKVRSALMYPVIMFIFMAILLGAIFVFVIPKIMGIFEANPELTLPWYTKLVVGISDFMINYYLVIGITGILLGAIFVNWRRTPSGSRKWDAFLLRVPVAGRITRLVAVSRFTRTLATLLNGGVPMLNAMAIVRNVVDNQVLAEAIDNARDNISEGESIAGPLKKSGEFPPIVIHMINIGEKTGELENMLTQVSETYDFQVKNQIDGLTSILEPIMIIVMGCVIGFIVFAVMVPVFQLSDLGGNG